MGPDQPLPLPDEFTDVDVYVESLLDFGTTSAMLRTLCGGVHILDFFTRSPDLYSAVLPETWRRWFAARDIGDILNFLMREDLSHCASGHETSAPPADLVDFVRDIRKHSLKRNWQPVAGPDGQKQHKLPRHIAVGMKVKKVHEVEHFAQYVDRLTADIVASRQQQNITHIADFGSGQNYLGRALASQPYNKHIIAIEGRPHNIVGAKEMDVMAGLAPKKVVMRNKKEWKKIKDAAAAKGFKVKSEEEWAEMEGMSGGTNGAESPSTASADGIESQPKEEAKEDSTEECKECKGEPVADSLATAAEKPTQEASEITSEEPAKATLQISAEGQGSIQYVEHRLQDGDLSHVVRQILDPEKLPEKPDSQAKSLASAAEQPFLTSTQAVAPTTRAADPNLMVISLHSCGNLLHHGLRSLTLNPSVKAVAMIGCCYNLMTERLGPPSYKIPHLRPHHPRLEAAANAFDPHGFPMSSRYARIPIPHSPDVGVRLNITARMMAVQAPQNWGPHDSEAFFTRHFYRALLQRIFLERGVVELPKTGVGEDGYVVGGRRAPCSPAGSGSGSGGAPIVIGSLRKTCYADFVSYVRGAMAKLVNCPEEKERAAIFGEKMAGLTDEEIRGFEERYRERKKDLSVAWSLMAFAAGVVEAMIVVDRWLWLREQDEVERCWVEPVFDYEMSPRNLVVVGLKK